MESLGAENVSKYIFFMAKILIIICFMLVQSYIQESDCSGRNILIVEDIYDTGNSMKHMVDKITGFGAKDVKVCVLLHKKNPENLKLNFFADYTGYFVPCKFVLGYGMDYNELCRDMRHVCIISQYGIDKYKQ